MTYLLTSNIENKNKCEYRDQNRFYEYLLETSCPSIQTGDVAYLVDAETKRPFLKAVVLSNIDNKLELIGLILIQSKSSIEYSEKQVVRISEKDAREISKTFDELQNNGFCIYSHRYLNKISKVYKSI